MEEANLNAETRTQTRSEWLLASLILARSTSYVMSKVAIRSFGTFNLLGLRFLIAFLFLLPIGWKRLRQVSLQTVLHGMLLGASFFAVMTAEITGLRTTNASTVAFLENTAIVFVPLFQAALQRSLPKASTIASTLLCILGVALLTIHGQTLVFTRGELFCLLAAMLYATSILLTDRVSKRHDPLTLGIVQVGSMALYSMVASLLTEQPHLPSSPLEWKVVLGLAIVCSGFGFSLQPLAQRNIPANRVGLFCALSPIGATVCGFLFLGESVGVQKIFGMALILLGMLAPQIWEHTITLRKQPAS